MRVMKKLYRKTKRFLKTGLGKRCLIVLAAAVLVILIVSIISCPAPHKHKLRDKSLTANEVNALDIAEILYAFGYGPEETAAVLGNIEMESGGIDYTSMEVYTPTRDPYGVNSGHSFKANAEEAHTIGPVKQHLIDLDMPGYVSNSRVMLGAKAHYRGGGYFGFSYAGMKELWDFCDNFDIDGDGTPEHYVWWQIPKNRKTPSGGELQILFSIGFSELFSPSFTNFHNFCSEYGALYPTIEKKLRYYTYAFDLLFELGKPFSHIEPFIPALENFDDPSGDLDLSAPWLSRDERAAFASKWYDFLIAHDAEIDVSYGIKLIEGAGLTPAAAGFMDQ